MSDGSHIALLIMTALQYLAPQFIEEGRLYWLRSPLYIVENGKQHQYFYNDDEFNKVRNTIRGEVTRAKGLGELDDIVAKESMFDPKNQRLEKLEMNEEAHQLLFDLMGDDVQPRKDFIFNKIDFSEIRE